MMFVFCFFFVYARIYAGVCDEKDAETEDYNASHVFFLSHSRDNTGTVRKNKQ
jgi:hypothetical protein